MNTLLTIISFTWGKILITNLSSINDRKKLNCTFTGLVGGRYHGYFIGAITDNVASVGGDVFAVDKTSVIITNFTHDGSDPGKHKY